MFVQYYLASTVDGDERDNPVRYAFPAREPAAATDAKHPDLGVGLSLVFLLAKTSDEFNKMVKVRAEMEALLKEIRDEVRSKDRHGDAPKASNRESTTSSCVTDGNDRSSSARMEYQAGTSGGVEPASCEKTFQDGGWCARMDDVLEEEFHAELEMLKVNYGSETPSVLPQEEDDEEEHYSEVYGHLILHSSENVNSI